MAMVEYTTLTRYYTMIEYFRKQTTFDKSLTLLPWFICFSAPVMQAIEALCKWQEVSQTY